MTQTNVIPFPIQRVGTPVGDQPASQANHPLPQTNQSSPPIASSVFNIHDYLPKGSAIHLLESGKGVQIIPHKIFEFIVKTTESRVELAVFACLIRYSLGFHRSTCEASNSFISEWTGLATTSVRRGLEGLLARKLVNCIKIGISFKDCTVYEIPIVKGYLNSVSVSASVEEGKPQLSDQKERSQKGQLHQQEAEFPIHFDRSCASRGHGTVPTGGDKKHNSNKTEENKNTNSSQAPFPENVRVYFSSLKSRNRKLRELEHFEILRKNKTLQEISDSLKYLLVNGLPGSGERCFAPMAFLVCSIDIVLSYVRALEKKARQRETLARQEKEKQQKEVQEAEEDRLFAENSRRFDEAFPTQELRDAYIRSLVDRYPVFSGNPLALKNLAVSEWISQQKK